MIITDKFVFIHQPKNAGTFVTHVLERVYRSGKYGRFVNQDTLATKHQSRLEIPPEHRSKLVLGTVRNPYDLYVSKYEFGWWKENPNTLFRDDEAGKIYRSFPDLSFEEFLDAINNWPVRMHIAGEHGELYAKKNMGWLTLRFLQYYSLKPFEVIGLIDDIDACVQVCREELTGVRLLRVDGINRELYDFLLEMGCEVEDIGFIPGHDKVFPVEGGRTQDQAWEKYYTPSLKEMVRTKDRLLFSLFPEFDV